MPFSTYLAGAACVYRQSGTSWSQEAKLTASDAAREDRLGWSVAVSGQLVAVGAFADDDGAPQTGSTYAYRRGGPSWTEETKLAADGAAAGDRFGFSVAMGGDTLAIGAPRGGWNQGEPDGVAFIFQLGH